MSDKAERAIYTERVCPSYMEQKLVTMMISNLNAIPGVQLTTAQLAALAVTVGVNPVIDTISPVNAAEVPPVDVNAVAIKLIANASA
jgi:hypothetical protein